MFLPTGCLLLSVLLFHPALAKVCNDRTKHGQDNSWFTRDGENLPIMVLMPMNESALMSSISQGIEPAVQLAIQHIRESRKYSFSLITKIYDTEVTESIYSLLVVLGLFKTVVYSMCIWFTHVVLGVCAASALLSVFSLRKSQLLLKKNNSMIFMPISPLHQSLLPLIIHLNATWHREPPHYPGSLKAHSLDVAVAYCTF